LDGFEVGEAEPVKTIRVNETTDITEGFGVEENFGRMYSR
jgi:hypothetical protein